MGWSSGNKVYGREYGRSHFGVPSRKLLDEEYGVGLSEDWDFWIMFLKNHCGRIQAVLGQFQNSLRIRNTEKLIFQKPSASKMSEIQSCCQLLRVGDILVGFVAITQQLPGTLVRACLPRYSRAGEPGKHHISSPGAVHLWGLSQALRWEPWLGFAKSSSSWDIAATRLWPSGMKFTFWNLSRA